MLAPGLHGQAANSKAKSQEPAESTALPVVQVPQKADDILQLAAAMNGLDFLTAKPWHVVIRYDQFDGDGDKVHSGTLEEFYVGPKKFKRSYTGDALTQTDVANESGLYRSGDQRWLNPIEHQMTNEALLPLYAVRLNADSSRLEKREIGIAKRKLPCVILLRTDSLHIPVIGSDSLPKFCFEPNTVMLRYTRGRWDETSYNNFVQFQGRYVARDVAVTRGGKAFLKIHVDHLEALSQINDDLFMPLAGSTGPLGGRIAISSGIMMDEYQTSTMTPSLPPGVRGVQGSVHLNFVIGKDGSVIQAEAVDGPVELRKPSVEAVRQFRFRPFLILDQPVEVESSTVFDFH